MEYVIEKLRVGISEGGMACGPVSGNVIGEVRVRDENGKHLYYCLAEVDGMLNFYRSGVSLYKGQLEQRFDDDRFLARMERGYFCGWESYEDFYAEPAETPEQKLLHYLAYAVRADWEETDRFAAATQGKQIGSFYIPLTDIEEELLEEQKAEGSGDSE